jgi:cytochrome c oxidase subunit 2
MLTKNRSSVIGYVARRLPLFLLLFLVLLAVGCETDNPQNTFAPSGDVADKLRDLYLIVMWPLIGIMVVVEGLLVLSLIIFRHKRGQPVPKQTHGNTRLEVAWTIAPAIFLLVLAVPTIATLRDLATVPEGDVLEIEVTGRQFSWSFRYPNEEVTTTNELTIPVDKTVHVTMTGVDVIHSFWVPKLAGKADAIPGRSNGMWFNATEPGTYSGQCAEFCGVGHWEMNFTVVAMTQTDFDNWLQDQQAGKPNPNPPGLTWRPEE